MSNSSKKTTAWMRGIRILCCVCLCLNSAKPLLALAPESHLEETLFEALGSEDITRKLWALEILAGKKPTQYARVALYETLNDSEPLVSARTAWVFEQWGQEEGADHVARLLKRSDAMVRNAAEDALRAMGGPVAVKALKEYTLYLIPMESEALQSEAERLIALVETNLDTTDFIQLQAWAHARLDILELLAVASDYEASRMAEYHGAHRWWEKIRRDRGWDKADHDFLVVIHTFNRPQALRRLFESLLAELDAFGFGGKSKGKWVKVHVLLVDDSDDPEMAAANRVIVEDMRLKGLRIQHWWERRQKNLIVLLKQKNPDLRIDKFIMKSQEALENPDELVFASKGYAGIRNMARLAATQVLREMPTRTLVVSFDDDVEMGKYVEVGRTHAKVHLGNYFRMADRVFAENPRMLAAGGNYTMDATNADSSVLEALKGVRAMFAEAAKVRPGEPFRHAPLGGFYAPSDATVETFEQALGEFLAGTRDYLGGKFLNVQEAYRPKERLKRGEALRPFPKASTGLMGGNLILRPRVVRLALPFMDMPRGEDELFFTIIDNLFPDSTYRIDELSVIHNRGVEARMHLYKEFTKAFHSWVLLGFLTGSLTLMFNDIPSTRENEGPGLLAEFIREHPAFGSQPLERARTRLRDYYGKRLRELFGELEGTMRELEGFLDKSKPEYWWNHSEPLRSSLNAWKGVLLSMKDFEWSSKVERDFLEEAGNVFEARMKRFFETVDAIPDWEKIMVNMAAGILPEEVVDAYGILVRFPEEAEFIREGPFLRSYQLRDTVFKIPLRADSGGKPIDFEAEVLPRLRAAAGGRLSGIRGSAVAKNLRIRQEDLPVGPEELGRLQARREGEEIVIPWAIFEDGRDASGSEPTLEELLDGGHQTQHAL
jgi:hypothetical protein